MSETFDRKIAATLGDQRLQTAIYTATKRLISHRKAVVSTDALPDYQ
jgi:hypothetical protein